MKRKPLTTIVTIAYVIFVFIIMFLLFHSKQDSVCNIVFSAEQIRSLIAERDHLKHFAVASPFYWFAWRPIRLGAGEKENSIY